MDNTIRHARCARRLNPQAPPRKACLRGLDGARLQSPRRSQAPVLPSPYPTRAMQPEGCRNTSQESLVSIPQWGFHVLSEGGFYQ
ncbi:MAG: hypothetical protein KatS3mg058_2345 [Roseiflexus sp.]|nr:MAG: hypothetical protein KatS3mg058_2345 [Roseiflexus sp.]